jgi:hypothetical protein
MNDMPRRTNISLYVPAERAISDAMLAVEDMPPHPFLTEAVILLAKAKDCVADYVDSRDSGRLRNGGDDPSSAPCEASQSGPKGIAQTASQPKSPSHD